MGIPTEMLTALIAGVFAFAGGVIAQFTNRKRTAAETEKLQAEAEKLRAETEALRVDLAKQRQELKSETEKIVVQTQQASQELVAEVEKFREMAQAQLMARRDEYLIVADAAAQAQRIALDTLTELRERFPDMTSADLKEMAEVLNTLSPMK